MQYFFSLWIIATVLILWGCGESGDSSNNASSNIDKDSDDAISSSSQISNYDCRDGETIKDKAGAIIASCSEGEWISVVPTSQENPVSISSSSQGFYSSSDKESPSKSGTESLCGDTEYNVDSSFCDTRDNRIYRFVKIGSQVWMAENLKYYEPENAIVLGNTTCFDNIPENCEKLGRMYTWNAAMGIGANECRKAECTYMNEQKVKGICPSGWHLPKNEEWNTLFTTMGVRSMVSTCDENLFSFNMFQRIYDDSIAVIMDEGLRLVDEYGFIASPTESKIEACYSASSIHDSRTCQVELFMNKDLSRGCVILAEDGLYSDAKHYHIRCVKD